MTMRGFTPEEDARLIELRLIHHGVRGAGGLYTIARKMGRHRRSIMHRLRLLAEIEEGYKKLRIHREWSPEETAEAIKLRAEGLTYKEIGERLGRSASSVMQAIKRLGRRMNSDIATVTYCTYGQCADRTVPCEACTTIEVDSGGETPRLASRPYRAADQGAGGSGEGDG